VCVWGGGTRKGNACEGWEKPLRLTSEISHNSILFVRTWRRQGWDLCCARKETI